MHFLKRSMSFTRFRVDGMFAYSQEMERMLEINKFRDLSEMSLEAEESYGWVSPENCLKPPVLKDMMIGPHIKLAMRIDKRKISSMLMKAHIEIEEQAALQSSGKKRLPTKERAGIKDGIREMLLKDAPIVDSLYTALYDYKSKVCYLFTTSSAVQARFQKLFLETFGLELHEMTPVYLAESWARLNDKAKALDSTGASHFADKEYQMEIPECAEKDFLGREFLTWLWYRGETDNWKIDFTEKDRLSFGIDELLVLESDDPTDCKARISGPVPMEAPEAQTGLQEGKKIASARYTIVHKEREFTVTWKADSFKFASLNLMKPETADVEERFQKLSEEMETATAIFDKLFTYFLDIRLSDQWEYEEHPGMKEWVRNKVLTIEPELQVVTA